MADPTQSPGQERVNVIFRRVVVKLTGESLADAGTVGLDPDRIDDTASKIHAARKAGAEIAVVVGGGNWIRGADLARAGRIRPLVAHQMGMTATIINGLALAEALNARACPAVLTCSMPAGNFTEPYHPQKAQSYLGDGRIVIMTGGTGNSFVTTDTCAAIRSAELQADALLKATKVDGVYSDDPVRNPSAKRYSKLTYAEVIDQRLGVMDISAVTICQQARIPIVIFNFQAPDGIAGILTGKAGGTTVSD